MKRLRKLYILVGVLVVAAIGVFAMSRYEEKKEQIKNSGEIILTIVPDSVKELSWKNESGELSFHKEGEKRWLYDKDENFPASSEKIQEMLELFSEFGVSFIIENVEDFGQYGLDKPVCTIRLKTADEKEYDIMLGDFSKMDSERYVFIGGGKDVYLAKKDPLDLFNAVLEDMTKHDKIPSFEKADGIRFEGKEKGNIVRREESHDSYCSDDIYFLEKDGSYLPLDTVRTGDYLRSLKNAELKNYVTYHATEEELKKYGLTAPELKLTVGYTEKDKDGKETSDTVTISVGRTEEQKEKAAKEAEKETKEDKDGSEEEADKKKETAAYARVGDSGILYELSEAAYKKLMDISYNTLRHQDVLSADENIIKEMDITLEDKKYTITSKMGEKKKDERTYYYQGKELENNDIRLTLKKLKADSFTDEQPTGKLEIGVTVHLEHENFETVQVDLYRYDGKNCLAVVDGKPVCFVPRSQVSNLMEAVYAVVL